MGEHAEEGTVPDLREMCQAHGRTLKTLTKEVSVIRVEALGLVEKVLRHMEGASGDRSDISGTEKQDDRHGGHCLAPHPTTHKERQSVADGVREGERTVLLEALAKAEGTSRALRAKVKELEAQNQVLSARTKSVEANAEVMQSIVERQQAELEAQRRSRSMQDSWAKSLEGLLHGGDIDRVVTFLSQALAMRITELAETASSSRGSSPVSLSSCSAASCSPNSTTGTAAGVLAEVRHALAGCKREIRHLLEGLEGARKDVARAQRERAILAHGEHATERVRLERVASQLAHDLSDMAGKLQSSQQARVAAEAEAQRLHVRLDEALCCLERLDADKRSLTVDAASLARRCKGLESEVDVLRRHCQQQQQQQQQQGAFLQTLHASAHNTKPRDQPLQPPQQRLKALNVPPSPIPHRTHSPAPSSLCSSSSSSSPTPSSCSSYSTPMRVSSPMAHAHMHSCSPPPPPSHTRHVGRTRHVEARDADHHGQAQHQHEDGNVAEHDEDDGLLSGDAGCPHDVVVHDHRHKAVNGRSNGSLTNDTSVYLDVNVVDACDLGPNISHLHAQSNDGEEHADGGVDKRGAGVMCEATEYHSLESLAVSGLDVPVRYLTLPGAEGGEPVA